MTSSLFSIACLVDKKEFKRELTDEEKLAIALELYESETWTVDNLVKQIIEMDKRARREEEGNQ